MVKPIEKNTGKPSETSKSSTVSEDSSASNKDTQEELAKKIEALKKQSKELDKFLEKAEMNTGETGAKTLGSESAKIPEKPKSSVLPSVKTASQPLTPTVPPSTPVSSTQPPQEKQKAYVPTRPKVQIQPETFQKPIHIVLPKRGSQNVPSTSSPTISKVPPKSTETAKPVEASNSSQEKQKAYVPQRPKVQIQSEVFQKPIHIVLPKRGSQNVPSTPSPTISKVPPKSTETAKPVEASKSAPPPEPALAYPNGVKFFGKLDRAGNPTGDGKFLWPDNTEYLGGTKDGTMSGKGKIRLPDGTLGEGTFQEGKVFQGHVVDKEGNVVDVLKNGQRVMLGRNKEVVQKMMESMKGDFWDKVEAKAPNHNFDSFSLQEFLLDRKAQDATGIQRGSEKFLGPKEQKILREKTEALRKEYGLQPPQRGFERAYFIDKEGRRTIDYDYLVDRGYNPQTVRDIPGAVFAYPNPGTPRGQTEQIQAGLSRDALDRAKKYLQEPGMSNMLTEIKGITGTPVLIFGMNGYRVPELSKWGGFNSGFRFPNDNNAASPNMSEEAAIRNRALGANIMRVSGLTGDPQSMTRNLDNEQGRLHFSPQTGRMITFNEVGELWMMAKEIQDRRPASVNHSASTQISTWHTDSTLANIIDSSGTSNAKDPIFWKQFVSEFQGSVRQFGERINATYFKHHEGQSDILSSYADMKPEDSQYAAGLYTERIAKALNIPVANVPLEWVFKPDEKGRTVIVPRLKKG